MATTKENNFKNIINSSNEMKASSIVIERDRKKWSVIFLSVYEQKKKICVLNSDVLFSLHLKTNGLCFNSLSNVFFYIERHKIDNCSGKS